MPPFDMSWTPTLENKLSTQIDGQLPDFIAEDHPKFSRFLKHYYQFLEAGELRVDVNIDNILLELRHLPIFLVKMELLLLQKLVLVQQVSLLKARQLQAAHPMQRNCSCRRPW